MNSKDLEFQKLISMQETELEKLLQELLQQVVCASDEYSICCQNHWNGVAKPLNGLGKLEQLVTRIGSIRKTEQVSIEKRAVAVFCGDNGVVAEGISQSGQEVTAIIARLAASGKASVSAMAKACNTDVYVVDMGVNADLTDVDNLMSFKIAHGTANFAKERAMTKKQTLQAILAGAHLALKLAEDGYDILIAGEGGIGNTTTTAAVASVLLQMPAEFTAGKGAGLSDKGLERKINLINHAVSFHQPNQDDIVDVLSAVGGFDIAAMTGFYLGCGVASIPAIIDGVIASVAALCAVRLNPFVRDVLLPSHKSAEPAAALIMKELDFEPVLDGNFHLGEGTGAVALLPLLDLALAVYRQNTSFAGIGMEAYQPL